MRQDVLELRRFYASPLGRQVAALIGRKVKEAWGDVSGLDVLGLGYATPLLAEAGQRRRIAAMPAAQGVEVWPADSGSLSCLVEDAALPFPNALFDRVVALHALEESEDPGELLREVGRVMAPTGRLIVAATARHGLWADAETTPFGQGRPFSRAQLERLLIEAELQPHGWTRALYAPPLESAHRWAASFERLGARLWPPFAGVILMEATKQTYAVIPRAVRQRVRATPVFQPAAVARDAGLAA
ncbi:MAG TPA: methyltransferase domain-containing protein [Caulobacteraceae bacterium]|jgi:SAM-dependent methyltransferase